MPRIAVISDNDLVSACFKNAEKIVTVDTTSQTRTEEQINASIGFDLVKRINKLRPDALILSIGGPSLSYLNKKIEVYQAPANTPIDDAIRSYEQNQLSNYSIPPPSGKGMCGGGQGKGQGRRGRNRP